MQRSTRALARGSSLLLLAAGALASSALVALAPHGAAAACGPGGARLTGLPGPLLCAHADEAPPGVDVTERVPTRELQQRDGAGPGADAAAEALGLPVPTASGSTSPAVECDGDGTSGYRVQALYVVESGATDRYTSLLPSLERWAAGTDDVVNRSAALTGGVRHLRYVTEPGADGTCEAKVLHVTVPPGSTATFEATIDAVRAQGLDDPTRKYLMWTDANVLCGIATMYPYDVAGQDNPNNGYYAQYARVDNACWGYGDGSTSHSVEAHELVHTLGAVNQSAPHGTTQGHCWDEADTMCYDDGGGHAMVDVCPAEREYLVDCGSDDYFSTSPEPGSYLAGHWNAASSRFLIGGGQGSTPEHLAASVQVNSEAVPGLPTQAEVTATLPSGRSVTSVAWTSRRDCVFSDPTELQTDVTCNASTTSATTLRAVVTDSGGETATASAPLTFVTGTARPVGLALTVDGQSGSTASVCTGTTFPVRAVVTDTATGLPVKGLAVALTRRAGSSATTSTLLTTAHGSATATTRATTVADHAARVPAGRVYAAASTGAVTATPGRCTSDLAGSADTHELYHGEALALSGTLTRVVGEGDIPVVAPSLPVTLGWTQDGVAHRQSLGSARTGLSGAWSLSVRPAHDGTLSVALPASAGQVARSADLGAVTVHDNETTLTAAADRSDVGYGDGITVSGRLLSTADRLTSGPRTTPLRGARVTVSVTAPGASRATVVGTATTRSDGTWSTRFPLRSSGTLTATYAGAPGQLDATQALGSVTAGTWTPAVALTGSRSTGGVTLTGTVSRTYGGATSAARGVRVRIWFTPVGGSPTPVALTTTTTSGTFSARRSSTAAGSYLAKVTGVVGYADASSPAWGG